MRESGQERCCANIFDSVCYAISPKDNRFVESEVFERNAKATYCQEVLVVLY